MSTIDQNLINSILSKITSQAGNSSISTNDLLILAKALEYMKQVTDVSNIDQIQTDISNLQTLVDTKLASATISAVGLSGSYSDLINKPGVSAFTNDAGYLTSAFPSIPYSVNSAKVVSGVASFITKVDNNTVSFDVSTPIKCTYPDNTIEINSSLGNINTFTEDITYYIVKEKGSPAYGTSLLPIEDRIAPTSPVNNQLWLDLSVTPYVGKKYNSTTSLWIDCNFVRLGQVTRASGILGTPSTYSLNGCYDIFQATIANGTKYVFNSNIGTKRVRIISYIECKTAQLGYSVGDRLYFQGDGNSGNGASIYGLVPTVDASGLTVSLTVGNSGPGSVNKTSGDANSGFNVAYWSAGLIVIREF